MDNEIKKGKKIKSKYYNIIDNIYTISSIAYVGLILMYVGTFFTDRPRYGILFFGSTLIMLLIRALRGDFKKIKRITDSTKGKILIAFVAVVVIIITYIFWTDFYLLIYERAGSPIVRDRMFGAVLLSLVFIGVYITAGWPVIIVVLTLIFYGLFGNHIPGLFKFSGFTLAKLIDISSTQIERGILGDLLQLSGSLIAIFIIFAGFVQGLGGFEIIIRFSLILSKLSKYLVTQSAVVASAIMGMFTGSGSANVAGTGSFTIPLMIRYNVPPFFAAAVEAVASAGGQIMPPVMGAAAFLMAEFLGVPYVRIAKIAVLPALIYFLGVMISVFHITRTVNIVVPEKDKSYEVKRNATEELKEIIKLAIPLLSALVVLLYLLAIIQLDAMLSGYYTIIFIVVFSFFYGLIINTKEIRNLGNYILDFAKKLVRGARASAKTVMEIALILSLVGVILVILATSGLSIKMNFVLLSLGEGNILLLLFLSAIVCIILGCVVSSSAVYILTTITVVPALVRVGFEPIIVHFYVFWYAILGLITPPVCSNVVAACRIAHSDFLRTAKEAMKVGAQLFLIPIIFVVRPSLLIWSNRTLLVFFMGLVASWAIATAFYGSYLSNGFKAGKNIVKLLNWFFGILAFVNILWISSSEYIDYLITFTILLYLLFIHVIYFKNLKFKTNKKGEN